MTSLLYISCVGFWLVWAYLVSCFVLTNPSDDPIPRGYWKMRALGALLLCVAQVGAAFTTTLVQSIRS